MGENFRRRLAPDIEKYTKMGVRDGIDLLKKAGSMDPLGEQQQWIRQHVDDPAKMLAKINGSDREDTPPKLESEVESDGSDIEVVISDDESEDLGDEDISDLDDFIASSGSDDDDDDDDKEDNISDEAENEEENSKDSGDDGEAVGFVGFFLSGCGMNCIDCPFLLMLDARELD